MARRERSLEAQAGPTRVLPSETAPIPAPFVALTDFEILSELGEGAQGRVYLARQKTLADRPVVLKISSCRGQEHLSLAHLWNHQHIVPLYWAQDDPDPKVDRRILCMPFFGTLTLTGLLGTLKGIPPGERTGQHILDALDQARTASGVDLPETGPGRNFLKQASYIRAVCWIGACLADALHYAHQRGLVHLDLKPSNVLIAWDGQPMLLDFHLARAPIPAGGPKPRGLGGTPLFMAPEQREALKAVMSGLPVPGPVDGRADQYALALMMYQALGGTITAAPLPRLDTLHPGVSMGLADVLARALEAGPEQRYPDALSLAEDLRRHLAHEPLRGVGNRSLVERWRKWRRRKPFALASIVAGLLFLVTLLGAGAYFWLDHLSQARDRRERLEQAWQTGTKELGDQRFDAAITSFQQALTLADALPDAVWKQKVEMELDQALRAKLIASLHALANRARFAAASLDHPPNWDELEPAWRKLWDARHKLLDLTTAGPGIHPEKVRTDLLDLALIWLERGTPDASSRETLEVLELDKRFSKSPALLLVRRSLTRTPSEIAFRDAELELRKKKDRTAWDHYSLARAYMKADALEAAAAHLDEAVALKPADFWANFYQGVCAYRRGLRAEEKKQEAAAFYTEAVAAFRAALAAEPTLAPVYHNRALAYGKVGREDLARADREKAARLGE